jgi:hypothetical protein
MKEDLENKFAEITKNTMMQTTSTLSTTTPTLENWKTPINIWTTVEEELDDESKLFTQFVHEQMMVGDKDLTSSTAKTPMTLQKENNYNQWNQFWVEKELMLQGKDLATSTVEPFVSAHEWNMRWIDEEMMLQLASMNAETRVSVEQEIEELKQNWIADSRQKSPSRIRNFLVNIPGKFMFCHGLSYVIGKLVEEEEEKKQRDEEDKKWNARLRE